ncbi:TPA: hypothetical protein ACFP3W_000534 [Neisseria subflava]
MPTLACIALRASSTNCASLALECSEKLPKSASVSKLFFGAVVQILASALSNYRFLNVNFDRRRFV